MHTYFNFYLDYTTKELCTKDSNHINSNHINYIWQFVSLSLYNIKAIIDSEKKEYRRPLNGQ
jgi:hypothetical protein